MLSADRVGGWANHYRRCERWKSRAAAALDDLPAADFHTAMDFALAYFVWSHSLREWLIKDGALNKEALDVKLQQNPTWRIVRDLANRSRHLVITQSPSDAEWSVAREYDNFAVWIEGRERHHVNLFFDGQKHRLVDVVHSAGRMWQKVLSDAGLV